MICPSCQRPAPGDGRFCSACGAELAPASSFPTETGLASEAGPSGRRAATDSRFVWFRILDP